MSRNENKSDIHHMKDILRTQLSSYYQNIAVSVFDWEGMPDQVMRIPRRQPEKQLYETGCFTMFRHEDSGQFFMLPVASMNIQKNAYGEPSQWRAMALGELAAPIGALKLSPENAVLFRNNDTYTPSKPYVEELIKQLVNVEYTLRLNINAQKMPWSMRSNNYNIISNKNLFRQIYECEPIVYHDDMMTDELELIKTDAPVIMAELNDAYNVYDQRICEFLGIDCVARDKKERLTVEEADANDEKIDSIKKVKLEQRKEGCDLVNDLWGIDLSVKLADYTKDPRDNEMKEDVEGGEDDGSAS